MKKLILLAGILLATVSCKMESTFYMENVAALVNVAEGKLFSDEGVLFNVTENISKKQDYLVDGARYYMRFDILDREMDIRIRDLQDVVICPSEAHGQLDAGHDPVVLQQASISGGYLNLVLVYYKAKASTYEHKMSFRHEIEDKSLKLTLFHDGNDENPSTTDSSLLESITSYYSVPLTGFDASTMRFAFNMLTYDSEGKATVVSTTLQII